MKRLIAVSFAVLAAACAAPEGPTANNTQDNQNELQAGQDCFDVQFLTGYESVDRDTVRVNAGPDAKYDVDIAGTQCTQLDWTHRLAIESTPSSWICVGHQPGQGSISFRDPATRRRVECYITEVRRVPEVTH